jgi:hypothetical protein
MGQGRPTCKGEKMITQAEASAVVQIIDRDNAQASPATYKAVVAIAPYSN